MWGSSVVILQTSAILMCADAPFLHGLLFGNKRSIDTVGGNNKGQIRVQRFYSLDFHVNWTSLSFYIVSKTSNELFLSFCYHFHLDHIEEVHSG